MNKQELIERIKKAKSFKLDESIINGPVTEFIKLDTVIELVSQVDEPQKVKIPDFVADIIEEYKERNTTIIDIFEERYSNDEYFSWLTRSPNAYNRAARAWLDGYEVEKTKYVVTDGNHLYFQKYQEDIEIVILVDEQPGTMEYVKKFDTKEEAQKAADILGWKVEEVQDD